MDQDNNKRNLKIFFIKLVLATIAVVVAINLSFNLIFSKRLEKLDKILLLNKVETRDEIKEKIRSELSDSLKNENLLAEEDKILLYKLYFKLKKEFEELDKSNL